MEPNYLWILYYPTTTTMVIKLTNEEKKIAENYECFENFIREELEDKYDFCIDDCSYMVSDTYEYDRRGF